MILLVGRFDSVFMFEGLVEGYVCSDGYLDGCEICSEV